MTGFGLAFTTALVDFVWQGLLVWLALLLALQTLGRRSAQVRYALNAAVLVVFLVLPVATTVSRYDAPAPDRGQSVTTRPSAIGADVEGQSVAYFIPWRNAAPALAAVQPWVLPLWSLGVMLLSIRLLAGGLQVRALRRSALSADEALRDRVWHLAARMGIRRPVQLVTSIRADGPGVIGWLRPLILLPPAVAMGLSTTQLDAVLAHELAHIRRHDFLVNIIQMIAETLLFYHPAIWWVSRRLRTERELCCDDEAVRVCGDATAYARALVTMARWQVPAMAMGSSGGSLSERVRRLLGVSGGERQRSTALGLTAIAVALTSIMLAAVGARQEHTRFEVASIKPAPPEGVGFGGLQFLPSGVVQGTRVPLRALIATAYDIQWRHIEGPSNLLGERFAIEARASASALPPAGDTLAQTIERLSPVLREMLKTLLAERFKLAVHVEKRDSPIYVLAVAAKGSRLQPAARDCAPRTMEEATTGTGPCGFQGGGPARGLHLHGMELVDLASALTNFSDRTVVDRTGIAGRFDIEVPPWSTGGPPRQSADPIRDLEPQPDPNAPSLFTVLQEQLGLRLEAARGPIDFYVIDHVERPTPN